MCNLRVVVVAEGRRCCSLALVCATAAATEACATLATDDPQVVYILLRKL